VRDLTLIRLINLKNEVLKNIYIIIINKYILLLLIFMYIVQ
jgi:hypothetical protein